MASIDNVLLLATASSSEIMFDGDDEEDVGVTTVARQRQQIVRVTDYAERVVPAMSDSTFKSHFRLTRKAFASLVERLASMLLADNGRMSTCITKITSILLVLTF